jgi:predicted MFS family arabinose efflux permease
MKEELIDDEALETTPELTTFLLILMTVSAGLIVCNQYFMQPLLPDVGVYFGVQPTQAGLLTTLTQVGYALGMIFLIPVADFVEKRRFICMILVLAIICLVGIFISPIYYVTLAICFLLGVTSVTPQLLVPITAQLAKPAQRGKAVGAVVNGWLSVSSRRGFSQGCSASSACTTTRGTSGRNTTHQTLGGRRSSGLPRSSSPSSD